jgi:hypothetical protein
MFVIGWVVSCRIIIVFIPGDAPYAPIGLDLYSAAIRGSIE